MQVSDIQEVAKILIVSGILLAIGILVLGGVKDTTGEFECASGYEEETGGICCLPGYTPNTSQSTRCLNDTWPTSSNVSTAAGTPTSQLNSTVDFAVSSIGELGSWFSTIALVIASVIIIGLVLLFRRNRL